MPRPLTVRQKALRDIEAGRSVQRVEIPRVTCGRCAQEGIYAQADGVTPRAHLRPSTRADENSDERVPTMVGCEEQ